MGIRDAIGKIFSANKAYRFGAPNAGGGLQFFEMQMPPSWGYQSYLKAYGEIGTLFACVNVISQAVAKVKWHLYELDKDGEQTEIFQHDAIDILNHMNPFQSRYQFMYLGTMYKLLVGEEFWQMNFNGKNQPGEIWLAPPSYMTVVPSATNYIDHYEFRRTGMAEAISFTVDEIIHIKTPNPFNEYRGLSPAQALTTDLDSERYAARYQQKFFFNDATPGLTIEYPAEGMPPADTRKELMQEWDERYRGFRNRGKTAFLWGGKANVITMSNRDMDFKALREFSRDAIMAAYHVPRSKLGITENVNRANAEQGDYDFNMNCVHPELCEIRESMNKELLPFFGDNLYLDFENPVPEDETKIINNTVNLFKAGIITRNNALEAIGLELLEGPEGDEYFSPAASFSFPSGGTTEEPIPAKRARINIVESQALLLPMHKMEEAQKELYWKDYVSHAESYEAKTIFELQNMYLEQKKEALANLQVPDKKNLIDLKEAKKKYVAVMLPILTQVMAGAIKNGRQLVTPPTPHKEDNPILPIIPQIALNWLKTRIGWAAEQIGEESAARLSQALAEGYQSGESIDQIAKRIEAEFDYFSDVRAERIARTEIMQASAQGAIEGYRDTGVVDKVQFYAALDERTCPDCMALHNEIFTLADSIGVITVHPSCRCVWLPVID